MEFTVDSKIYIGWESNLSIIPQKYRLCNFSEHKIVRERYSWKRAYSMILPNNTKWVSSQLTGCGKANLGWLGRGHFYHLSLSINYY